MAKNGTIAPAGAMLTLSKAAEYAGVTKQKMKAVINNARFASIFTQPDNVRITHFHPDVPDLIEISSAAIDAWKIAKETKAIGSRSTRNGQPRRYELRFTDDRLSEVNVALEPLGLIAVPLYKPKAQKQAVNTENDVVDATPAVDLVETGDLVSA